MSQIEVKSIEKFYDGAEIFITGGTGFIGTVLIEKLLRSCPSVKKIYLLTRSKNGMTATQRIEDLIAKNNLIFRRLKSIQPDFGKKLHAIEGNAIDINLGISNFDREKLKACSVIFHVAASIRFDDPLKKAILLNTRGTRELCNLAKDLPNLKSLIHISTAYIQPKNFFVEEKLYPSHESWKHYIKYAENIDEDTLNILTPKLTDFAPNTYTFTKHLAESVCIDYMKEYNLPITIYRPSIVTPSESEPLAGYLDNMRGPMAFITAAQLGIFHATVCPKSLELNLIPVDLCVKGLIVSSVKNAKGKDGERKCEIEVINAASIRYLTVPVVKECGHLLTKRLLQTVDTMHIAVTLCKFYVWTKIIFQQLIPALIIDILLRIAKEKPRALKIQRTMFDNEKFFKYFQRRKYKIINYKYYDLNMAIPPNEKADFTVTGLQFTDVEYMLRAEEVVRTEIFKEKESDQPRAVKRYFYVQWISRIRDCFYYYMLYLLLKKLYSVVFE